MSRNRADNADYCRANRIRRRIARGAASDIDRAWLAKYAAGARTYARGAPQVSADAILAEVCRRFAVSMAGLRSARGVREVQHARAVAIVAMRVAGIAIEAAGRKLRRGQTAISHVDKRMRGRAEVAGPAREIVAALARPVPRAGDRVILEIEVGSRLWNALDRISEMLELNDAAIGYRLGSDLTARCAGTE